MFGRDRDSLHIAPEELGCKASVYEDDDYGERKSASDVMGTSTGRTELKNDTA